MTVGGMNGDAEGIAMLIKGGPSTGKKLRLFPRFCDVTAFVAKMDEDDGSAFRPPRGSVDAEVGILASPNSPIVGVAAMPVVRNVGSVMADLVTLILGRSGWAGPMSELECIKGGGSECKLADAEAASVALSGLSAFNRFIDILRKKPHLPVLVEVLDGRPADRGAGGEDSSISLWWFIALAARRPSFAPRLPNRDVEVGMVMEDADSGLSRACDLFPKTLNIGLTIEVLSGERFKSEPADRIFRNPRGGGRGNGSSSSSSIGARGCDIG